AASERAPRTATLADRPGARAVRSGAFAARPSALAILPVLGGLWLATAVARFPVVTPDVWWHLATGRLVATAGIPHADPFSWTLDGRAWTVHEWLPGPHHPARGADGGVWRGGAPPGPAGLVRRT